MQLGVHLHFRDIDTNVSSPRGLYHHKHGFLIDKLPTPPFLTHKIFTHLIFTLPIYPLPKPPITPLFPRPIYLTPKFPPFHPSSQSPKILIFPKYTRNFPESPFLPSRTFLLSRQHFPKSIHLHFYHLKLHT